MGFSSIRALADCDGLGQTLTASLRKVPSQASVAQWWVDLSMASGQPPPNFYASTPLESAVLDPFRGILHGDSRAPAETWITEIGLMTPTAALVGAYYLLDYLLYYPFIDLDDLDPQTMITDVELPRYGDGDGVRAMLVCVAPTAGGGSFTFDYVNQDGVTRTSPVHTYSTTASSIASLLTSQPAQVGGGKPFLDLLDGDTGIRSIVSVTNIAPGGGLGAIVLVRPLLPTRIAEINTMHELELVRERPGPVRVYDGAFLGLIMQCAATVAAGTLAGRITYAWS